MRRIKTFLLWIYDWITVLTGMAMGVISFAPDVAEATAGLDISPLVSPEKAIRWTTYTAIAKAVIAFAAARVRARREARINALFKPGEKDDVSEIEKS